MKSSALYPSFLKHIRQHPELSKGKRFLLACSGGLDSSVLCHLAYRLEERMDWTFAIGHVNYKQRGEASDLDEESARTLARRCEMDCYTDAQFHKKKGGNFQEDARHYRYRLFAEWAKAGRFDGVWTAHHRDDQVETVLFRLLRGAGAQGLSGIKEIQVLDVDGYPLQVIRPLLPFRKCELEEYAKGEKLEYRKDESNDSREYTRNRIRNDLMPLLRELSPKIEDRIQGLCSFFGELEVFLNAELGGHISALSEKNAANDALVFSIKRPLFLQLPILLQAEALHRLFGYYLPKQFVSRETIDKLRNLIVKTRKVVHYDLGQGFYFEKNADSIRIYRDEF